MPLTNHTNKERKAARTQFFSACYFTGILLPADFSVHLAEYKGSKNYEDNNNNSDYKDIYRILPNTGAANVSTVGKEQYLALIQEDLMVTIDTSTAGKTSIKFGKGSVTIPTEIGKIDFEVLDAPTPFLLCLADTDRLKVYFNNTTDKLFYLNKRERATAFLTKTDSTPRRFKFTLKNNYYFNYKILVDIMYLRNILTHNVGTNFASAEFRVKAKIMGMAVKAINNIAGPNSLVLTLLVFGAYPRITIELPLLPLMVKRSEAI
ncbi:hypothetical protein BU23DRAFT_585152 [Bimuria novae-zelandiae CBS 107.79]|uniref:Uncharacterized protein n=1 Tax=Bimuria novae-zelandiae CBS 107.79 TaxID=1447943 RepID=A0A6A5UK93_9PLEO|nr:hypothetical protein BU23DRAFT_585152 [Bimuria novae-zelandiae CBS 107.79]